MPELIDTSTGTVFVGSLDDPADVMAAAAIAARCETFSVDDEDECYLMGARSCFDCRARRWVPNGFSCMRGALRG